MKNYRKPKKIRTVKRLGKVIPICLVLMFAGGVLAETFNYFAKESIDINSNMILLVDGIECEDYDMSSSITLNASETANITHVLMYNGSNPMFNVSVVETNNFQGIEHHLYLDNAPVDDDFVILWQKQPHILRVEFVASYNLSGTTSMTYDLTLLPSPVQP